jgi:hypothetical protein
MLRSLRLRLMFMPAGIQWNSESERRGHMPARPVVFDDQWSNAHHSKAALLL